MSKEDITGGLDLLGDWLDAKGYTEEAGLCTRAMDEINRLQEKLNGMLHCSEAYDAMAKLCSETEWTLNEKIEALRADHEKLRSFYADTALELRRARDEIERLRKELLDADEMLLGQARKIRDYQDKVAEND